MFANIVARSIFSSSLLWSLEVSEVALVIIAFMGGAIAYPRNEHMAFNVILDRLSRPMANGGRRPGEWTGFFSVRIRCLASFCHDDL